MFCDADGLRFSSAVHCVRAVRVRTEDAIERALYMPAINQGRRYGK